MLLLLIFIVVPLIEITLFIQVGSLIGLWPTLAIVIATAFAGSFLIRAQGLEALGRINSSLQGADDPLDSLANGALILIAGIVLLTPGFFTDAVGLSLLIPSVRREAIRYLGSKLKGNIHVVTPGSSQGEPRPKDYVEGEFTRIDEDQDHQPR
ncbi:MAG: FxsA family protein [Pseudomonadota bacterium]